MKLDVVYRSCSRSNLARHVDVPKSELSLTCLNSLIGSIAQSGRVADITLHVLDDHSDPETVAAMQKLLVEAPCETKFVALEGTGQAASMDGACEYARENCHDLMYFVEDDYLHAEPAIREVLEAREDFSRNLGGRHVIISPCDHAVEYFPQNIRETRLVLGRSRHWRTATGTTSTYLIDRWTLMTYWELYKKHATYAPDNDVCEANTINLIYKKEFCFSPVPSLAAHVSQPDITVPFFDHERLWKKYEISLKVLSSKP